MIEKEGNYQIDFVTAPTNAVVPNKGLNISCRVDLEQESLVELIPIDFRAGESSDLRWSKGVLDQARTTSLQYTMKEGIHTVTIGALDANVVLERILIYPVNQPLLTSYIGPKESYFIKEPATDS